MDEITNFVVMEQSVHNLIDSRYRNIPERDI